MKLEMYLIIIIIFISCNNRGNIKVNSSKKHFVSNFNNDTIIGGKKLNFKINSFKDSVLIEITSSNDSFLIKHFGDKMNEYEFQDYINSIPSQYVHSKCQISPIYLDKRLNTPNNFNNFRVNKTDYYILSRDSLLFQIKYLYFDDGTLKQLISKYESGNEIYYINNLIHSDTLNLWETFDEEHDTKFKIYNYTNLGYDSIAVFDEMDFLPDSFCFSNSILRMPPISMD